MLKIRAGWGAVVCAGICLLMATSVFAADDYGYANFMINWFMKQTQKAEIMRASTASNGVANINMTAGNINSQIASTTIRLGGSGSGLGGKRPLYTQGYSGYFIVGNSVFGQGVFSQDIYPDNNQVVVQQQTVGFFVDAAEYVGAGGDHSFFPGVHTGWRQSPRRREI